jgi:hypothetical protein
MAGEMILRIGRRYGHSVGSFAEASQRYERMRGTKPSSLMKDGEIWQDGRLVARVSYNAKVWPPEPWFPEQKPIFNPYASEAADALA